MDALIETFDIVEWLEDNDIFYQTHGKNIGQGSIGMECPFCQDSSSHLGIHLEKKVFNCWVCGEHGSILKLIRQINQCSYYETYRIIESYQENYQDFQKKEEKIVEIITEENILPKECSNDFPQSYKTYLASRRFNPDYVIKKYSLKACPHWGDWKFRIIAPVFLNQKIVSFIGIDTTRQLTKKYKNCPNEKSILPIKQCLYNIDSVKENCVLVEGVLDVWRIGDGCVASLGTEITKEQISLLMTKEVKKFYVLFDSDATKKAIKVANLVGSIIPTEILELKEGDPADLDNDQVKEIRNECGL